MADAKSLLQIVDRSVIQLGEEIKNPKGVRFFTEHDVQAYLYNLLSGELEKQHLLMASAAPTKRIYQYSTWQLSADAASILHCEFPQKKRSVRYDIALLSPPTELKPGQDAYRSRPVAVGIEIKCSLLWHPPSIEKEIREAANKKHNQYLRQLPRIERRLYSMDAA